MQTIPFPQINQTGAIDLYLSTFIALNPIFSSAYQLRNENTIFHPIDSSDVARSAFTTEYIRRIRSFHIRSDETSKVSEKDSSDPRTFHFCLLSLSAYFPAALHSHAYLRPRIIRVIREVRV